MQSLVDRSCAKRSNEERAELLAKRQRRAQSLPEEAAEWEDAPQIRGGLSRPRPPPLGSPPNRATNSGSQANTAKPLGSTGVEPSPTGNTVFIDSDDEFEEGWRAELPPEVLAMHQNPPPQVGNTATPLTPVQGPLHLPTPPHSGPSDTKQGGGTGADAGLGGSTATTAAGTHSTATGAEQLFSTEEDILRVFDELQRIIILWVEECLPDTLPSEFEEDKPERYWELCGWTKPLSLGNTLLHERSLAKYVYESWVWRLLHQEIFRADSLAWAGGDVGTTVGGLAGRGSQINRLFNFLKKEQPKVTVNEYQDRTERRARAMQLVREGGVTPEQKYRTTGCLVEEMLVAFHPYFPDEYQPISSPENIEVLIRDTRFLILKAQELDDKLRSARHVYEMILGKDGDVVRISGVPSPKMEGYWDQSSGIRILHDDDYIALIVVPGLVKNVIRETPGISPLLGKLMCRHAKAFTQRELLAAVTAP